MWTQQHRGLLRTMDGMISAQLRCTEPHTPWFVENDGWDDIVDEFEGILEEVVRGR